MLHDLIPRQLLRFREQNYNLVSLLPIECAIAIVHVGRGIGVEHWEYKILNFM